MRNQSILTDNVRILADAIVVPPDRAGGSIGVLDKDGKFVIESQEFTPPFQPVKAPEIADVSKIDTFAGSPHYQQGCYLYAGWLHQHFGHVITESIARLWPLQGWSETLDGIVFASRGPKTIWRARKSHQRLLDIFSMGAPHLLVTHPTRFEKLIVADAGCGIGSRMKGSPAFRKYLRSLALHNEQAKTEKRIYLSRRRLPGHKGRVFGEERLWQTLEQNGYVEVHLQDHTIDRQIELISSASHIVALDGSPMHLVSYFAASSASVAMIVRRNPSEPILMADQFANLNGRPLLMIEEVLRVWNNFNSSKVNNTVLAEVDLERIGDALVRAGLIDGAQNLTNLSPDEVHAEQVSFGRPKMQEVSIRM